MGRGKHFISEWNETESKKSVKDQAKKKAAIKDPKLKEVKKAQKPVLVAPDAACTSRGDPPKMPQNNEDLPKISKSHEDPPKMKNEESLKRVKKSYNLRKYSKIPDDPQPEENGVASQPEENKVAQPLPSNVESKSHEKPVTQAVNDNKAAPRLGENKVTQPQQQPFFKKPNLHNITIAKLLPVQLSSPVSGGNLKATPLMEDYPSGPPSSTSTMSGSELSQRVNDFNSENVSGFKSILKQSTTSAENLVDFEQMLITDNKKTALPQILETVIFKSIDPQFVPISLTFGHHFLFVASPFTDMVGVFKNEEYKGVLKINGNKQFRGLRYVHFVHDLEVLVVLDEHGFHFFAETGEFKATLFQGMGKRYRGLEHTKHNGDTCLVTLDISQDPVAIQLINLKLVLQLNFSAPIVHRVNMEVIKGRGDQETKCRFLAMNGRCEVLVSSMGQGRIYSVNLKSRICEEIGPFSGLNEPSGIAVMEGYIFVSCQNSIEVIAPNKAYVGTLKKGEFGPIGICVSKNIMFIADKQGKLILKFKMQ